MVGITASGLMGRIRGKDEVTGPGSPRKEVASPMGQHTQFCVYISEYVIDTTFTRISFPIVDAHFYERPNNRKSSIIREIN